MAKHPDDESKLSSMQERFCLEYIVDHNGAAAAKRAQYSEDTAAEQACRMLKAPKIKDRIAELMDEQAERTQITADRILVELFRLATVDLSEAFDAHGHLLRIDEMPANVRRSIAGFEIDALYEGSGRDKFHVGETKKIKLYDKIRALELLGKNKKLFTDKLDVSGTLKLEDLVAGQTEEDLK